MNTDDSRVLLDPPGWKVREYAPKSWAYRPAGERDWFGDFRTEATARRRAWLSFDVRKAASRLREVTQQGGCDVAR